MFPSLNRQKLVSAQECQAVLQNVESTLQHANKVLAEARSVAEPAGYVLDNPNLLSPEATYCGNTDHVIIQTGDEVTDRIEELKRRLVVRKRRAQPESRGDGRWDKPKKVGERRRRIVREADLPDAPPVPPPASYVIFVCQMTAKIRHDRGPNEAHNQARVLTEISSIWRSVLTESEREYYQTFCEDAKAEYQTQLLEYRATGHYRPSETFEKIEGTNIWVRRKPNEKNALERELAGYETFNFLPRPPDEEEAYQQRLEESKERRKQKLRLEAEARRLQKRK